MITLSKFSNFRNELSENDELREYELSGSECMLNIFYFLANSHAVSDVVLFLVLAKS